MIPNFTHEPQRLLLWWALTKYYILLLCTFLRTACNHKPILLGLFSSVQLKMMLWRSTCNFCFQKPHLSWFFNTVVRCFVGWTRVTVCPICFPFPEGVDLTGCLLSSTFTLGLHCQFPVFSNALKRVPASTWPRVYFLCLVRSPWVFKCNLRRLIDLFEFIYRIYQT